MIKHCRYKYEALQQSQIVYVIPFLGINIIAPTNPPSLGPFLKRTILVSETIVPTPRELQVGETLSSPCTCGGA
jgi:hypothetical protein